MLWAGRTTAPPSLGRRTPDWAAMRRIGNSHPEFRMAAWTRSRASWTAVSSSPTTWNADSPGEMSTSTSTTYPSSPTTVQVYLSVGVLYRQMTTSRRESCLLIEAWNSGPFTLSATHTREMSHIHGPFLSSAIPLENGNDLVRVLWANLVIGAGVYGDVVSFQIRL